MPLWIVIYLGVNVVGSIGPLPYGMEECLLRVSELKQGLDPSVILDGGFSIKDMDFKCQYHYQRPTSPGGDDVELPRKGN